MKNNDIDKLVDRLQGFDADELQQQMTDGLEQWCIKRSQNDHVARRVLVMFVLLVALSTVAITASPTLRQAVFTPKEVVQTAPVSPTPVEPQKAPLTCVDTVAVEQDTISTQETPQEAPKTVPVEPKKTYDFINVTDNGDTFYCTVVAVARSVSVSARGPAMHPAGALVLPGTVEHDGLRYRVVAIADSAFYNMHQLTSVTLPATVVTIGRDAFCGCSSLDSIVTLAERPPRIMGEWCFWEVPDNAVLHVPCRSATAYRSAHCWDYFDSIADPCEPLPTPDYVQPIIKFSGNYLIVEGVFGEVVRVFDFEGRMLASGLCNGQCRISIGNGMSYHHTSAFLVQVGDGPAIKVSAPLRNSTSTGSPYVPFGNSIY